MPEPILSAADLHAILLASMRKNGDPIKGDQPPKPLPAAPVHPSDAA
jgi:hypothetical protein